ncbi:MAG: cytochrome c oxidase assembly protein [Burkholderiaceae bacterium]|nr:cytochrome c oxidase assembly protein [Burkholderiaceae bacterium]
MIDALLSLCTAAVGPALPQGWWLAWSLAPATVLPLAALVAATALPPGAGLRLAAGTARRWRLGGCALLALALVSPLCRLSATLASAHMAQLMVLLAGVGALAWGWRPAWPSHAVLRGRDTLVAAAVCHGALLWLWHVPGVYAAVLTHATVHVAAYAVLLASAAWFWMTVMHVHPDRRGAALIALLATLAHTGLLGALLTFATTPLYPLQAAGARAWGLDPIDDQQLAGLLMWVPGSLAYLGSALALALAWFMPERARGLRLRVG